MTFTLPGFDRWTFQVVLCGSTLLEPGERRHRCADTLLRFPCCALVAGPARDQAVVGGLADQS